MSRRRWGNATRREQGFEAATRGPRGIRAAHARPRGHRRSGDPALVLTVLVAIGAGLAALLAAGLVAVSSGQQAGLGLPEPGALTRYGLPVVKVVADVAAALCIGFLWFAGFATAWGYGRALGADGRAAVRAAGWAAVVWFAAAASTAPCSPPTWWGARRANWFARVRSSVSWAGSSSPARGPPRRRSRWCSRRGAGRPARGGAPHGCSSWRWAGCCRSR
ncbi:hypothetical protein ACFQ0O_14210 [Saccharopolyspora spinosporotrichia]